jgi:formate/nitrite transporter
LQGRARNTGRNTGRNAARRASANSPKTGCWQIDGKWRQPNGALATGGGQISLLRFELPYNGAIQKKEGTMSLEASEITAVKPDMLTPAQTEAKLETIGTNKAAMPLLRAILLGILAGLFVGLGGMMLGLVLSTPDVPFFVSRLIGGLAFCLGLVLVLLAGAELFTGNTLIIAATLSKKVSWGAYAKNLVLIWVTNLIGSLLAVAIVYLSGFGDMNGGLISSTFISLAATKVAIPPLTLLFKAILCNMLVCLAVWMSYAGRTFVDKFLAILFPVTAFVACGAEHSVANMFLIPLGALYNFVGGTGAAIDIVGIAYNLGMVTLGNMIGGIVLVGLVYWAAFKKSK